MAVTISQGGSYYLTTNMYRTLTISADNVTVDLRGYTIDPTSGNATAINGITVAADDVTLDLAGHTLIGPGAGSGYGIFQADTLRNLTVLNGKVAHWQGTALGGVYAFGTGNRISGVQAATNYHGIVAYDGCTISDCTASYNGGNGIVAHSGCTLSGCAVQHNTGDGIRIQSDNRVVNCVCPDNGYNAGDGASIHALGADNRIESNNVTDNDRGLDVDLAGNFIVRNTASGNTLNWDIVARKGQAPSGLVRPNSVCSVCSVV